MSNKISIAGLNKADVLATLYNTSKPQGMGFLDYDPTSMTREQADELLEKTTYFDYVKGRIMKIDLSGNELDTWAYNRDNGPDAAENAITEFIRTTSLNSPVHKLTHSTNTQKELKALKLRLDEKTKIEEGENMATITLGLSDVKDVLGPALDRIDQKKKK